MAFVDYNDLLDATDGGLKIIVHYYPDAASGLERKDKKFKIRNEKTASASIRQKKGIWHVTDFGGDQRERNGIGVCMLETGKTFAEAVQYLAELFRVEGTTGWKEIKPDWDTRPLKEGENPKDYSIAPKEFTDEELASLGPCVTAEHCLDYHFHSIKAFTYCKANEASVTSSNENYPIFAFHHDDWAKIYQPLSFKKEYRFRFLGSKPERYIYGMDLLKRKFQANKKRIDEELTYDVEDLTEEGEGDTKPAEKKDPRLDQVFIVSGGSDGLNLYSFGYVALWFNSESEHLNYDEYRKLQIYAKEIIYIPDLDATGLKQSLHIGLKFLDIKIMMLPPYLSLKKDRRGNPCKDFKDFVVNYYTKKEAKSFNARLKKLIENALPAEFWKKQFTKAGLKFHFRPTQFYNFLKMNGYGRIKDDHTKEGFHFVKVEGNVVKMVSPVEIEAFVHHFLKDRQMPIELRDMIYSRQISGNQLSKLDELNVEFSSADREKQYFFFENAVLDITPEEIKMQRRGDIDRYIWEKKMHQHIIRLDDKQFTITKDKHGNDDIVINEKDNWFFNYLINTSRIHWRKELEDSLKEKSEADKKAYRENHKFDIAGLNLNGDEQLEQKLHLINKIYALGYMLHTYKSPHKPWALYAMDNKLADISESHGGSGKSVFLKAIQHVLKQSHYINGRDSKKTQDDFIYHGVTDETDYIMVDDCHAHLDFGFFFNAITGDLDVNNKNGLRFVIPFDKVPKLAFSSNYPPNNLDPSLARRLLYAVFSDYYHFNQDSEYNETRAVSDDFNGKTLFKDFDDTQWNKFFNFCAEAVQFFLAQTSKIDPPMANVTMRNLLQEMGTAFKDWAEVYFEMRNEKDELFHLDNFVVKNTAFEDLKQKTGLKYSPNRFKKSLKAYAKFNEWVYNPAEVCNDNNDRILQKIDGETKEVFYIKTNLPKTNQAIANSKDNPSEADIDDPDELPF